VKAIKTYFDRIEYKSRLEADVARITKMLGYRFEYESTSYLLPNGVHYWPDFYIPDIHLWIESRGYDSDKGESQIEEFSKLISAGFIMPDKSLSQTPDFGLDVLPFELVNKNDAPDYLVIKYDSVQFTEYCNRFGCTTSLEVALIRCSHCKHYSFVGQGSLQCRFCGAWDGNGHIDFMKYINGIKELKIFDGQSDFD
jgi:hypothetical protein